jgi:hypothetical protein
MNKLIELTLKKYDDLIRFTENDLGIADLLVRGILIFTLIILSVHNLALLFGIERFVINWGTLFANEEIILLLEYNSGKSLCFSLLLIGLYYNLIYSIFKKIELHSMLKTYDVLEINRLIDTYDLQNNKVMSNKFDELISKELIRNNKHSSTMVYDENGRIGSKFVEIISEGHWMTTILDKRNSKFTIEHYRTWENLQNIEWQKRLDEELLLNNELVFGFKDKDGNYSRKPQSNIFTEQN